MTIRVSRAICSDRSLAEQHEWLLSNGLGSYACGTVAGSRSRSYHGLLVAATGAPADPCSRTVLVTALQEHWIREPRHGAAPVSDATTDSRPELGSGVNAVFSCEPEADENLSPIDHRAIAAFRLEGSVPCWRFALGDALLEKRITMQPGRHTTTVQYRLLQAAGPLRLALRVLVNDRNHHGDSAREPIHVRPQPGGFRMRPDPARAPAFVVLSDRGRAVAAEDDAWCWGEPLSAELERGLASDDPQRLAGWILAELTAAAPTLSVVASCESDPGLDGERALADRRCHDAALLADWRRAWPQIAERAPSWVPQLVLAADAFPVRRGEGASLIAGFPWFGDWARDTMISLSGLTLATGRAALGARILRTYANQLNAGLLPNRFPEGGRELGEDDYNTVDATLWFLEALRRQHDATADGALIRELLPLLRAILEAHCHGTRHGIRRDPTDGLLRAGREGLQLTWMDAKVNGAVITPRIGKPVEVNALWVAGLETLASFEALYGQPEAARRCAALAAEARQGFQRFWNPAADCCFDVLEGPAGQPDPSIRPNQLLALALAEPLLPPDQARRMLQVVSARLLTPVGLRSLDHEDPRYQGRCSGGPVERDRAYHQGTVWSWWLGIWALAQARLDGHPNQALQWLEAIGDHLATAGLGSISEIFDGDPPHQPRGCFAQAWSVAEVLRAWHALTAGTIGSSGPAGPAPP